MYELYIANKNYSSWSLRPWVLMRELADQIHRTPAALRTELELVGFPEDRTERQSPVLDRRRYRRVGFARDRRVPGRTARRGLALELARPGLGTKRGRGDAFRLRRIAQPLLDELRSANAAQRNPRRARAGHRPHRRAVERRARGASAVHGWAAGHSRPSMPFLRRSPSGCRPTRSSSMPPPPDTQRACCGSNRCATGMRRRSTKNSATRRTRRKYYRWGA